MAPTRRIPEPAPPAIAPFSNFYGLIASLSAQHESDVRDAVFALEEQNAQLRQEVRELRFLSGLDASSGPAGSGGSVAGCPLRLAASAPFDSDREMAKALAGPDLRPGRHAVTTARRPLSGTAAVEAPQPLQPIPPASVAVPDARSESDDLPPLPGTVEEDAEETRGKSAALQPFVSIFKKSATRRTAKKRVSTWSRDAPGPVVEDMAPDGSGVLEVRAVGARELRLADALPEHRCFVAARLGAQTRSSRPVPLSTDPTWSCPPLSLAVAAADTQVRLAVVSTTPEDPSGASLGLADVEFRRLAPGRAEELKLALSRGGGFLDVELRWVPNGEEDSDELGSLSLEEEQGEQSGAHGSAHLHRSVRVPPAQLTRFCDMFRTSLWSCDHEVVTAEQVWEVLELKDVKTMTTTRVAEVMQELLKSRAATFLEKALALEQVKTRASSNQASGAGQEARPRLDEGRDGGGNRGSLHSASSSSPTHSLADETKSGVLSLAHTVAHGAQSVAHRAGHGAHAMVHNVHNIVHKIHDADTKSVDPDDVSMPFKMFVGLMITNKLEMKVNPSIVEDVVLWQHALLNPDLKEVILTLSNAKPEESDASSHRRMLASRAQAQLSKKSRWLTKDNMMLALNTAVFMAVVASVLSLALSLDYCVDCTFWQVMEFTCCAIFLVELGVKIKVSGPEEFFNGLDWRWNWGDAIITLASLLDMIGSLLVLFLEVDADKVTHMARFALALRVLRLLRMARLMKMLRSPLVSELANMLSGFMIGMPALLWVLVLIWIVLWVIATGVRFVVVSSNTGNRSEEPLVDGCGFNGDEWTQELEDQKRAENPDLLCKQYMLYGDEFCPSILKCTFTVFRCMIGDCTSRGGQSLPAHWSEGYSTFFDAMYAVGMIVLIFGLFNVITAVFVESTMKGLSTNDVKMKLQTTYKAMFVKRKLEELVRRIHTIFQALEESKVEGALSETSPILKTPSWRSRTMQTKFFGGAPEVNDFNVNEAADVMLTEDVFDTLLQDRKVQSLLEELDIDLGVRNGLFRLFKHDSEGRISIHSLLNTLMKLRGTTSKVDLVAPYMAMGELEGDVQELQDMVVHSHQAILEHHRELASLQQKLEASGQRSSAVVARSRSQSMALQSDAADSQKVFHRPRNASVGSTSSAL